MPAVRATSSKEATAEQVKALTDPDEPEGEDVEDITTGANNGLTLADMAGLDYDDPKWDELLDQMSLSEMELLVGNGGWMTMGQRASASPRWWSAMARTA